MADPLFIMEQSIDEDYQAWEAYPKYRWLFNKLELSLALGYDAGPACVPVKKSGKYIVRPIYNLYGMGMNAKVIDLDPVKDGDAMTYHAHIPPGHFWCEYFEGKHYSIDFEKVDNRWVSICVAEGKHKTKDNLTKFHSWEKVSVSMVEPHCSPEIQSIRHNLPSFLLYLKCKHLNIECIGKNIIEVHLRTGNDFLHNYPVGTTMFPIWTEEELDDCMEKGARFIPNHCKEEYKYSASGYVKDVRKGYRLG